MFKIKYKVSVIIPAYNAQDTLKRCLESVFSQKFDPFEVIVVNDGSVDRTAEVAQEYTKYSNFTLINQQNGGVSRARWAGVCASRGEYISFVDADDCIDENMLAKMYNRAKKEDADIAVCNWYSIVDQRRKLHLYTDKTLFTVEENVSEIIFKNKDGHLCNKIFKKEILTYDIFEKSFGIRFCEDLLLGVYLVTKTENITYLSDFLYFYFENSLSVTERPSKEALFDILFVHDEIYKYFLQKEKKNYHLKAHNLYATGLIMLFNYLQTGGNFDKDLVLLKQETFKKITNMSLSNFILSGPNFIILSKVFLIKIRLYRSVRRLFKSFKI